MIAEKYVFHFLYTYFEQFNINTNEIIGWKTDFIIGLATQRKFLNICIPWIIEYFTKLKSATIDLNRYKIENFLMLTTSKEINDALINVLNNRDCHIREHIADIIGEKINLQLEYVEDMVDKGIVFLVAGITLLDIYFLYVVLKINRYNRIKQENELLRQHFYAKYATNIQQQSA